MDSRPTPDEIRDMVRTNCATLGPNVDRILELRQVLANYAARFEIARSLADAEQILADNQIPRWEYHPTSEQMQARNGSQKIYMYFYWRKERHTGLHLGPDGRRKTYIGSNPARQQLARLLDANLTTWERLQRDISHHSFDLLHITNRLGRAALASGKLIADLKSALATFIFDEETAA